MEKVKGFDEASGQKLYGYGKWIPKHTKGLKKKLRAIYNEVHNETGMNFPDIDDYGGNSTKYPNDSFEAWYQYLVDDCLNDPRIHEFRICSWVSSNKIIIADNDTCGGFEDDDWNEWEDNYEETLERWNNEYE